MNEVKDSTMSIKLYTFISSDKILLLYDFSVILFQHFFLTSHKELQNLTK